MLGGLSKIREIVDGYQDVNKIQVSWLPAQDMLCHYKKVNLG